MTEDDAKTKNCPLFGAAAMIAMATIAVPGAAQHFEAGCKCEGSACMMWRWDVGPEQVGGGKNWDGHCGLAGRPMPPVISIKASDMTASEINTVMASRRIGKGVYSNPQPGDADHGK